MYRSSFRRTDHFRLNGFTLIELLTVMAIIAILAGLTLAAVIGVTKTANRKRAQNEIAAISSVLESYKIDNGAYPQAAFLLGPPAGAYTALDPSSQGGLYQQSSQALYQALAGKTNFADPPAAKYYMTFKTSQLGNYKMGNPPTYIQDPFGFSYGYSTGNGTATNVPYSGAGFFDLWSTGGTTQATTANPNPVNTWISNWPQ